MKKLLLLTAVFMLSLAGVNAQSVQKTTDKIYGVDAGQEEGIKAGNDEAALEIVLDNKQLTNCAGLSFDLYLPEGISAQRLDDDPSSEDYNAAYIELDEDRGLYNKKTKSYGYTVSSKIREGFVRVTMFQGSTTATIGGEAGDVVMRVYLDIPTTVQPGAYSGSIKDAAFSTYDAATQTATEYESYDEAGNKIETKFTLHVDVPVKIANVQYLSGADVKAYTIDGVAVSKDQLVKGQIYVINGKKQVYK